MEDVKPAQTAVTDKEKQLISEISELLKQKKLEQGIAAIKKLIKVSKNESLVKEYGKLLAKLTNIQKKASVAPSPTEGQFDVKVEGPPLINFNNIRGMARLKKALSKEILLMIVNRKRYLKHKLKPSGLLLYGPPGVGKSFFLDALAGQFQLNIIKPDLASLFSQWVGETEKNIVKIVTKAMENQPCLIVIDETDAKIRNRANIEARGESIVNLNATTQFLETMQAVHNADYQILFAGASNMIWDVDPAAKRPGRLGNLIYVPPPTLKDRFIMFVSQLKTVEEIRISAFGYLRLALATTKYSPSDIEEICIQAKKEMLYKNIMDPKNQEYFTRKFTREEYLAAKTALPQRPKEYISTLDIIKILKRDFKNSSLDIWYVETYKAMVGWEEIQKETVKGKIFSKTIKRKIKHDGKITKDERKLYKDMLRDVKRSHSRWLWTILMRGIMRIMV